MTRTATALMFVAAMTATSASANETIYFVGNGFFPTKTYAEPGDIITVRNFAVGELELDVIGITDFGPPNCNNPNQWDDSEPDCNNGDGNNEIIGDAPGEEHLDDTMETKVTVASQDEVKFQIGRTGQFSLKAHMHTDSATEADYIGQIITTTTAPIGF